MAQDTDLMATAGEGLKGFFDMQGDAEGVAVQTTAFVAFRYVGQAMGRLEDELFEQFH